MISKKITPSITELAPLICQSLDEGRDVKLTVTGMSMYPMLRDQMDNVIIEKAVDYHIAFGSLEEIEEHNILNATYFAMNRAIEGLREVDFALIDGNRTPKDIKVPCATVVKGDAKSMSIAAASILAKVTRDRLLVEYDEKYPLYEFAKHKGYGTKLHTDLIKQYGPCEIHRLSFLKNILGEKE